MNNSLLIIEDDEKLALLLRDYFLRAQFAVTWADSGEAGLEKFQHQKPDCIVLDISLPGMDGLAVCREIRRVSQVPILFVTAKVEEVDRLLGLALGADDYICKPFSPREVVARVHTVLRRIHPSPIALTSPTAWQWQTEAMKVSLHGQALVLTPVEFRLLWQLHEAKGRILSRTQLLDAAHAELRDSSDRAIDSHIRNLRKKIKQAAPNAEWIRSVYGVGYAFEEQAIA